MGNQDSLSCRVDDGDILCRLQTVFSSFLTSSNVACAIPSLQLPVTSEVGKE